MQERLTKFRISKYRFPVKIIEKGARLELEFSYNPLLIEEIKVMEGSKWHGYDSDNPRKIWSIANTPANRFQLDYLEEKDPYAKYDAPLIDFTPTRKLYNHQLDIVRNVLTKHYFIAAADTGVGKSLAAIEIMEASGINDWTWCAPKSALNAVKIELETWKSKIKPYLITYDTLRVIVEKHGVPPITRGVIFDESSRLKNHTAQRSQAAQMMADAVREKYGDQGYVLLMTGSFAPKSPLDAWSQCRIACPGYLRETRFDKFKTRLALIKTQETITGSYPSLVTWWDDELKCKICGKYKDENPEHNEETIASGGSYHNYEKSVNEVSNLYKRMKGLVGVWLKSTCLDLPEKHFRVIKVSPTREIINAARLIAARASSTIECITLLRELSDGFQYSEEAIGTEVCSSCKGNKVRIEKVPINKEENKSSVEPGDYVDQEVMCSKCKGKGEISQYKRVTNQIDCPKEEIILDLLDEYDDIGRIVVYGGFQGTVDRCINIAKSKDWHYIKADGRGWQSNLGTNDPTEMLKKFADKKNGLKIAFIGQASAAGSGLNLQASPVIAFYSNDNNGESRIQAINRAHRIGMDIQRGCLIIDIVHLPTDQLILNAHDRKQSLQSLTLGEIRKSLDIETITK